MALSASYSALNLNQIRHAVIYGFAHWQRTSAAPSLARLFAVAAINMSQCLRKKGSCLTSGTASETYRNFPPFMQFAKSIKCIIQGIHQVAI